METFTLDELVATVAERLRDVAQSNGQVSDAPDARTIRYYSSLGLVDRPLAVRNRQAIYGPRHTAQAVAVKHLQAQGWALSRIQARLAGASDEELAAISSTPFWAAQPARSSTPTAEPLTALRLAPGVTLVLDHPVDDLAALHAAAAPLIAHLRTKE